MNCAVICFTENGRQTARRAASALRNQECITEIWCKKKGFVPEEGSCVRVLDGSLDDWTRERFSDSGALIFVGAAGIAVRAIAPYVVSKKQDPAVLCIDEKGTFVISLLSGHIGRANELALSLAHALGATPVITTATDINHQFAVDVFARNNGLHICDMTLAKEISAALLDGKTVGFHSDVPVEGDLPPGLCARESAGSDLEIYVGQDDGYVRSVCQRVLMLRPADVVIGVGCRKGKDQDAFEQFILQQLAQAGIDLLRVSRVCSIDLKAEEEAITSFCRKYRLPYQTYSAKELQKCTGDFSASPFVSKTTGVDNVCERSAVLGSQDGILILRKTARDGMTLAAAQQCVSVTF